MQHDHDPVDVTKGEVFAAFIVGAAIVVILAFICGVIP